MNTDQKYTVTLQPVLVPVGDDLQRRILRRHISDFIEDLLDRYHAAQERAASQEREIAREK